jgi:hypothetical protein
MRNFPCYKKIAMCSEVFHYFDFVRSQQKKVIFMKKKQKKNIIPSSDEGKS